MTEDGQPTAPDRSIPIELAKKKGRIEGLRWAAEATKHLGIIDAMIVCLQEADRLEREIYGGFEHR